MKRKMVGRNIPLDVEEEFDEGIFEKARELAKSKYGEPIGEGHHRIVFRDGDWVVKVPTRHSGIRACEEEFCIGGDKYAKTSPDPMSKEVNLPVVRMEFVVHVGCSKEPDWTWGIDMGQVGRTKDGRLVAYDWEHC